MWTYSYRLFTPESNYKSIKEFLESDSGSTDKPSSIEDPWGDSGTSTASGKSETTQPTESSLKICPKCKTNKRQAGTTGRIKPYCKGCEQEYAQERYSARREFINGYKLDVGCQICGYKEHPVALEFDHIDPSTSMPEVFIDHWESAELAAAVLGLENPEDDKAVEHVEDQFIDKYGVDLDTFADIARKLVPLCAMDRSPLADTFRRGFVRDGVYIVKITTDQP